MHTEVAYDDQLQSGRDSDEDAIVTAAVQVAGLNEDNPEGEDAGCGGPGLVWLHVVCSCEAVVLTDNSLGGHSCS